MNDGQISVCANILANTGWRCLLMASIHTRTNKDGSITYRVMFRIDGRQAQESFFDPDSAARFRRSVEVLGGRAAREAHLRELDDEVGAPTLAEWLETYLDPESGMLGGVTDGTRDGYRQAARLSFLGRLGEYRVDAIRADTVRAWLNWQGEQPSARRKGQPVSAKTVKNYHAILSAALEAARERGVIDVNPARGLALPKGQRPPINFITEAQFAKLYRAAPEHYRAPILAIASSGMRFGEMSALEKGDVIQVGGEWCLDINKAWKRSKKGGAVLGPPKSQAGVRLVSVDREVVEKLSTDGRGDALLFPSRNGTRLRPTSFNRYAMLRAAKDADLGFPVHAHDLRHSHASWLIARGVPLPYVQKRLGHEKIDTTVRVYGHLMPEALAATRGAAGDAIRGALGD